MKEGQRRTTDGAHIKKRGRNLQPNEDTTGKKKKGKRVVTAKAATKKAQLKKTPSEREKKGD